MIARAALPETSRIPELARAVADRGGRLLIVGGWVRDQLRGEASKDLDAEIFGLRPASIDALLDDFGSVGRVGQHFPVWRLRHQPLDIAYPRDAALDYVAGSPASADAAFARAARHRDLTVNAIAWDPLDERLLDPMGGIADLEARRLRAIDPTTFPTDPVRGLRVARLHATLGAEVDAGTLALCRRLDLAGVPVERKTHELRRMLVEPEAPSCAFAFLDESGLLEAFPLIASLRATPQDPRWHPEGDVFVHTLMVIDAARRIGVDARLSAEGIEVLQWAALCHDFGKPRTTRLDGDRVRALGHEAEGAALTAAWLAELRVAQRIGAAVTALVAHHLAPAQLARQGAGPRAYRRLARKLAASGLTMEALERLARADHLGRTTEDARAGVFAAGDRFLECAAAAGVRQGVHSDVVSARTLIERGLAPGPTLGRALARARALQDETGERDPEAILGRLRNEFATAFEAAENSTANASTKASADSEPRDEP